MSGEIPAYQQDIRWFCGELQRRGMGKSAEGQCSAFAERVAIKLEGKADYDSVREARVQSIHESIELK